MFDGGSMFDTSDSPAPEASNYFEELLSARQRSSNILSDLNRQQADMRAQVVAGGLKDPSKAAQQLDELYKAGIEAAHEERLATIACINFWREFRAQRARDEVAAAAAQAPAIVVEPGRGSALSEEQGLGSGPSGLGSAGLGSGALESLGGARTLR